MTSFDSYSEDDVEVVIDKADDGWRLWVNVGGQCKTRIYRIKHIKVRAPDPGTDKTAVWEFPYGE
ncbi:MAG: hypothetical protein C5B60_07525 [Chloroflexi bacterium]|nr:MAG: hypothetical protein C5B60_07525 [Chloroflexota bacterium]